MGPSTKDELHMVEVEGQDAEGQKIKAALVSLKPSSLPSVSKLHFVFAYVHFSESFIATSDTSRGSIGGIKLLVTHIDSVESVHFIPF